MSHVHCRLFYHIVWSTWDREPLLVDTIEQEVYALIHSACKQKRAEVHALGGIADHVHLLVTVPRTVLIPDFMELVKGMSSRALNDTHGRPGGRSNGKAATALTLSAPATCVMFKTMCIIRNITTPMAHSGPVVSRPARDS